MDTEKLGKIIAAERKKMGWTQTQLADKLAVSDKAVSKWERGAGCPDVATLPIIAGLFQISLEKLLNGDLEENIMQNGNILRTKFYVCPLCGNILTAQAESEITCCGRKLALMMPKEPDKEHLLQIEQVEDEYYLTTEHPMSKEHYIAFVALLKSDTIIMKRTFPQWDLNVRLPKRGTGLLLYYCTKDGLFVQRI